MSDAPSRRILVRGVNWLGDAVMSTPALLRLREAHPRAHLALLTQAKLAELWTHHPAVDQVLTIRPGEGPFALAKRLRLERFETALILPNSHRSALEAFLARIPRRIGHARAWRNLLLTNRIPPRLEEVEMHKRTPNEVRQLISNPPSDGPCTLPSRAHHLYQYLHLATALGAKAEPLAPLIAVTEPELDSVRARFGSRAAPRAPLLGLNAGAEYGPAKRWPQDRFVAAAVELQRRLHCHWWVVGGPADVPLASAIAAEIGRAGNGGAATATASATVQCLAGQLTLRELCAALKACDLLLTNDTGPMHLAAAVGTTVVVPFGSTSPELTGPGLPGDPRHRFLTGIPPAACSPCFRRECPIDFRCMHGITVEQVVQAVLEALPLKQAGR